MATPQPNPQSIFSNPSRVHPATVALDCDAIPDPADATKTISVLEFPAKYPFPPYTGVVLGVIETAYNQQVYMDWAIVTSILYGIVREYQAFPDRLGDMLTEAVNWGGIPFIYGGKTYAVRK